VDEFFGSRTIAPTASDGCESVSTVHDVPASVDFQTPPSANPA
jgi:hypothetical protein